MRLAILGASGHGKVVADTAELLGHECVFFDDAWPSKTHNGAWLIVGDTQHLESRLADFTGVVVAIGNNRIRQQKIQHFRTLNVNLPTLIHPSAVISSHAAIGDGSVVFAQAVVNASSSIGCGVILNTGCTVDHDCEVQDFAHISPGAHLAGGVQIGEGAWVGMGTLIKQLVTVGAYSTIGMGSVVLSPVADHCTVIGNPARILKT